jgi:hypothetical protein
MDLPNQVIAILCRQVCRQRIALHAKSLYLAGNVAGKSIVTTLHPLHLQGRANGALPQSALVAGLKADAKGTHSSRTIMLGDLAAVLSATRDDAHRRDYVAAITESNCLGKPTGSTRRLSAQRLSELYILDPSLPLYRVFRRLWDQDAAGRPLLAIVLAVARDPLLAATAEPVLSLPVGAEYQREASRQALRRVAGERFNSSILDKVLRNTASSWTQSGHLQGRTFKKRCAVKATVGSAVLALYLGYLTGFRGSDLFASGWFRLLDCTPSRARELALEAKRLGLIDLRIAGDVVDLKLDRLVGQG